MVDDLGVAVTLPSPVRAPVAPSPCDTAAEAPGSSLVPFRPVTSPVGSSATASATPYFASTSSPPSVLQELIYEITVEGLCGDDVGGDVADDDSVAAEDVPLQAVDCLTTKMRRTPNDRSALDFVVVMRRRTGTPFRFPKLRRDIQPRTIATTTIRMLLGTMRTRLGSHACLMSKENLRAAAILLSGSVVHCS
ncbi:hypothetical protein F442_22413 [Phytophthora nicotianae P10297]|uniref:Uncharacterized protein n=1 Tax=Phytophthora nicotianae P10297 TaxID=1317064 RepID=W2Y0P0_PHYNI|nr:hypothetical protein F442_22413 [Phytophthora nicotianae P10297]